ncbi:MAG: sigma 54-interacting transcriptional regulator [Pirellulales bacterium]|nr:sigma 54-interacting transcriptional regulator [Pirellulales bacterium]
MDKSRELLLRVWQEACRHIEIAESAGTIAPMLVSDMPLGQLVIRRVDPRRSCLETAAVGLPEQGERISAVPTPCSAAQLRRIGTWCADGTLRHRQRGAPLDAELQLAVPFQTDAEVLAGPLAGPDGSRGILVFVAAGESRFDARHQALARVLLDPFAAALANDHQLCEMASLREAAEAENRSLLLRLGRQSLGDTIVGTGTGLATVIERVDLVARSDAPVLIFGETGTGKELIARTIHMRSPRAEGPVLRVNCGAIPTELIDSELFGHERGAFTGAVESRKGWFERADGGTLFLDEIGELPPAAQVRLLRILQDGWLERVGGQQPIHVDVRIVAATHCDLADMVGRGEFRADLWYRIAVFPIVLPPLRERLEDVAELARHFAERAARRFGLPVVLPSEADIRLLASYSWPGNIRELASVMDRAAILGNGVSLDVGKALGVGAAAPASPRAAASGCSAAATAVGASLDDVIRAHIEATLAATAGRVEGPHGAAVRLGVNPNTLRARMRKLGVNWRRFRGPSPS